MNMKNCITISMKKNEVLLKISEDAEQKEIMECLKSKMTELKRLYKDDKTPIYVSGKVLKNKEMEEVQKVIKKSIDVEIQFDSPKSLGLHEIKRTFSKEIGISETKFHKGSLRSGQKVEFEGSIVILGDVNGGAEVIAGENIIILGELRGLAHAGAKGNKQAIIATNSIDCPQIRISNVIKELEKKNQEENVINIIKSYAYINEENELVLE